MSELTKRADLIQEHDDHFGFGENWSRFLTIVDDQRVAAAKQSIQELLKTKSLVGRRFLDAGSGSGLFSLAAYQLGAEVSSFDLDPNSVACTRSVKTQYAPDATNWQVYQGSLADRDFLSGLGAFDIVYCWGVVHHTGRMWACLENLLPLVAPEGAIILAIYNDQLYVSKIWSGIKRIYQKLPPFVRAPYVAAIGSVTFIKRLVVTILAAGLRLITLKNPFRPFLNWIYETRSRGMHAWYDLVDWVGGWPFEVAKPEDVFRFMRDRGFVLQELTTCSGHGCNEFVFIRKNLSPTGSSAKASAL